jgi:fatty acid desaturase
MRTAGIRAFTNRERQARIRTDLLVAILLVALAVFCWGTNWPLIVATIAARFMMLSLLDNAPHYGTAISSGTYARNTGLPRWARWLVMGHNFHGIHHGATGLKWQELGSAFARTGKDYEGRWTTMVLRQFKGPVFLD